MRVGAVDCGTNSIRLLIADLDPASGSLSDIVRTSEVVRLGQGVDRTGMLDPEALARTLTATARYAATCRAEGVQAVRFVATSASRDAKNAGEFIDGVRAAFGDLDVSPEVVSGDEEAQLSFVGATGGLRAAELPGPYLVVDLGGGSTELVRGLAQVESGISLDVGSVRLTERHLHGDPPTLNEIANATVDVELALARAADEVDLTGIGTVVGLAGSITTITAMALDLPSYQPARIHLAELLVEDHELACTRLLTMTRAERAGLGFMHPGRIDVIGAGALVWQLVLARVASRSPGVRVVTSEHDILDGIALSLA
ncbi:MAG: Ppx/GppA family phosphatase [Phycicoccus sp.]|nr:Ppx/GppA family phosphatase [Phycicoccus sp.]